MATNQIDNYRLEKAQAENHVLSATVQKWKRETEQKWTERSEGKVSEDRGPDGGGRLLEDPEFGGGMEEDGDVFSGGGSDLEAATVELDAVVVGDPAGGAQGEV
jgi:hypothetical protein